MTFVPIAAVVGYAVASGASPVLQKIGADIERRAKSIDLAVMIRVMRNKPYLVGIALQIGGLVLGLVALRVLPLFLVQSVLAASIIVTAITERIITRHHLSHKAVLSILVVLIGLALLSMAALPSRAVLPSQNIKMALELAPIPLAVLGLIFVCLKRKLSAILISLVSGAGFGAMALLGRIMTYPAPFWHVLINPTLWSLLAYGIIAQFLFVVSLQRASGTTINALTSVTGTLAPAITGILLFNDQIRGNFEIALIIGALLIVAGSLAIARYDNDLPESFIL